MRLENKVAIVTGAAKGLGASMAQLFAQEGAKVIAADMMPLTYEAENVEFYQLNVTDAAACQALTAYAKEKFGKIDILVNSAGIIRDKSIIKMPVEDWELVLAVDLSSLVYCSQAVLPGMMERRYGKIVHLSSMGFGGAHGQSNYAAAKHGVVGLSRVMAKEYAPYDINTNCICPAAVATDMILDVEPELLKQKMAMFPRKRPCSVEEMAAVIAFLSSDDCGFINGERVIVTDGRMCV